MCKKALWTVVALIIVGTMMLGCGGPADSGEEEQPTADTGAGGGSADFPARDPAEPFALDEKGTVTMTRDGTYDIQVLRESGEVLFRLIAKKTTVIDPEVELTIQTMRVDVPEELADQYVAVGEYAFELHATDPMGYGFSLRPVLEFYLTEEELQAARDAGGSVEPLKGNVIILFKEQRAPKWVTQTSLSWDEEGKVVTLSNISSTGAFRLVAKKGQ